MTPATPGPLHGSVLEVFTAFLRLGCTSFGGPMAHLSYFHREFVLRRQWLSDQEYAQLIALCQFLPGPTSSQLGFSVGLLRAGFAGGLAAFIAFTIPSALLMVAFASYALNQSDAIGQSLLHGLKLVAVAVVAQGLLTMARQLCPDWPRRAIAVVAALIALLATLWGGTVLQLVVVVAGACAGLYGCRRVAALSNTSLRFNYGSRTAVSLLLVFAVLLLLLPLFSSSGPLPALFAAFYRAGALVFGGGHVVLPLLQEAVVTPGWVTSAQFMAGYGAAQAVPGPLFSLAAYLGASMSVERGGLAATIALLAIFLPGLLLISGVLPFWGRLSQQARAAHALAGVNAAVVGLLAAAFYDPVWVSGIQSLADLVIATAGFILLQRWRLSALWVVLWCVTACLILDLVWT